MPRPVGPSSGVTSRPSFVSGSADTMERQIKKRADDVYRQTLANLAKLEQEKQDDGGGFSVGGAFKAFGKGLGGLIVSPGATALDTMDWANQQLQKYVAGKEPEDQFDPADAYSYNLFGETYRGIDAGLQRAKGDIAAIPFVGEPSASPTASDIRNYGVLEGVARAGIDYGNLAATVYPVAKAGAVNAGLVTPTPSPFKPLTLDQVPATAPTTPYSQIRAALAEDMARVPEPTIPRQQIAPRLQVPSQFPNVPPMPPGFPLPRVPDNMDFYDLWRSPEGMSYFRAGETINPRETIDFAFDPEMAYLVHSGRPELVGNVLDPFRNLSGLNDNHLRGVALGHDNAIRSAEIMEEALDNFVRTGVWNGNEIIESMPSRYGRELGEVDLREAIKASDMSDQQLQEFVDTIQTRINRFRDYVSRTRPYLALSRREPFMSYYPATVGGHEGYARWHSGGQGGAMYLAGVPSERATSLFGPGIYEKKLGVPEWQAFGQQRPIASLSGFPRDFWGNAEYNLSRAFAIQKVIENRIARGLYKDGPIRVTAPDTPAPAGRVAPGFVSPEPVAVGNVATLPDGASVRLDAPEQSVEFVAAQGSLDQVPTQHLWQAISENAGEGKRYQIIGEAGGHIGMTRYQDTATGQYLGLKYNPGETPYYIMWPDARPPGPLAEVMSNDVAVAVGFPDMNLRLIVNQDNTLSIATELAQSVYNSNIFDTFKLREKIPMGLDALGNELKGPRSYAANVSIDSRIRKAIFDDLVTNTDNNVGNYLFAEQPDGSFSVVPIDNELTFQSEYMPEWGARSNLFSSEAMNWSVRTAFFQDPDDLLRQIKQTVADVQSRLTPELRSSLEQRLKKRLDDVVERVTTNGTDPADVEGLIEVTAEEIDNVVASLTTFATQPTDYLANMYFKIIKSGTEQI
jgi:hypothetical protein